jgi:hypothetical protein
MRKANARRRATRGVLRSLKRRQKEKRELEKARKNPNYKPKIKKKRR